MHDPFSFLDENQTGDGDQLETVPVGAADTISIVFTEQVNVDANDPRASWGFTQGTCPTDW